MPELDKIIVSVHVVFNEVIPDLIADYLSELEKLKIDVAPDSQRLENYDYLVGTHHIDDEDGLVYETTRVVVRKGFIVAYRRLVTSWEKKKLLRSTWQMWPVWLRPSTLPSLMTVFRVHPLHLGATLRLLVNRAIFL
jgi:hypothetical protein